MNCIFGIGIILELGFDSDAKGYGNIRRVMRSE